MAMASVEGCVLDSDLTSFVWLSNYCSVALCSRANLCSQPKRGSLPPGYFSTHLLSERIRNSNGKANQWDSYDMDPQQN